MIEKIFGHGQTADYLPYFLVKRTGSRPAWETLGASKKLKNYMKKHNLEIVRGYLVERLEDEITQDINGEFKEVRGKLVKLKK